MAKTAEKTTTKAARGAMTRKGAPHPKGGGTKTCTVASCKRAYRAKGYCFFHYKKWRREELEGVPPRYKTCKKAECRKRATQHGLCDEHVSSFKAAQKGEAKPAKEAAPEGGEKKAEAKAEKADAKAEKAETETPPAETPA
jgi:hypothetical protein